MAAGGLLALSGLPYRIDVSVYAAETEKVKQKVRFCVLADLHCRPFGQHQSRIRHIIEQYHPDAVLIPGDLFDVDRDFEVSFELIRVLAGLPVFFTGGNHDNYLWREQDRLYGRLKEMGVTILEDDSCCLEKNGEAIEIAGLRDMGRKPARPVSFVNGLFHTDHYRILVSHRPCHADFYGQCETDAVVCGHAHGGQWCIPFTKQGLFVKEEGFFPKYTEGMHDINGRKLVISRGLASGHPRIPRLFNDPEVVFLDVVPK